MQSLAEQRQACATPNDFIFAAAMREVEAGVGGRGVVGYDYDAGRAIRRFNEQRVVKQNLEDSVMMALDNATVADGTNVHDTRDREPSRPPRSGKRDFPLKFRRPRRPPQSPCFMTSHLLR